MQGKTLIFRDARTSDAERILRLRTEAKKGQFLSATSNSLEAQQDCLRAYATSTGQAYFIIERAGEAVGTVRLYGARAHSFCWGSWIIADGQPAYVAMESALMVYAYALHHLGFCDAHFDVRKANEKVWKFHERFGAVRVKITELDYFYTLSNAAIRASMDHYHRFLSGSIQVSEGLAGGALHPSRADA